MSLQNGVKESLLQVLKILLVLLHLPPVPDFSQPIEFFLLLFGDALPLLIEQTNLFAIQSKKHFVPTTEEIKIFLAINLLMGIKRSPSYRDYWSSRGELRDSFIASKMSCT